MNTRYTTTDAVEVKPIQGIQFSVLSTEEIRAQSVVHVTTSELYDKTTPKPNGLYDLRMGTTDKMLKCRTCECDILNCQGHYGHIDLACPVYNVCFVKNVHKILQCVCMRCSRLLLPEDYRREFETRSLSSNKVRANHRFRKVHEQIKKPGKCPFEDCQFEQPKWIMDGPTRIECVFATAVGEPSASTSEPSASSSAAVPAPAPAPGSAAPGPGPGSVLPRLTAKLVLGILRKISDADCQLMGFHPRFSHPKNMIIESLVVPPPVVRPSVMMDPTVRTQDDLTHKLLEIIKCNQALSKAFGGGSLMQGQGQGTSTGSTATRMTTALVHDDSFHDQLKMLTFHVSTLMDNEIPGQSQATQRTGRAIKSICQRIKSKEGRVRGNLMGKRVDFSARTVITAEPNIDLDELGVPVSIAKNLTFTERVTQYNKSFLQRCVNNGPDGANGVGANFVVQQERRDSRTEGPSVLVRPEQRKDLRFAKDLVLEEGDAVERHLKDGDLVVFNRQPTLHKMSMMGHRVRVMEGKTFRLNLSVCGSYNADFDGDEMNLFLPCTHDARAEVQELMMVSHNIVSPQANRPVMGIVQDALLACSKLTRRDVFLNRAEFTQIMCRLNINDVRRIPIPCILKPQALWSGKQLFSMVLPKKAHVTLLDRRSTQHDDLDLTDPDPDTTVADTVVNIVHGELLSGILCKKMLGTSGNGLVHRLFTEGSSADACRFISQTQYLANAWLMSHGFSVGLADCVTTTAEHASQLRSIINNSVTSAHGVLKDQVEGNVETRLNQILNRARDISGREVQRKMESNNSLYSMVSGGSKGSVLNIAQIMACVGQQNVNGKRIEFGYQDRALPHFHKFDNTPEGRGFVKHSYLSGLEPHEFFFHAMGGREGVIDTAIKTSDSGYTQRRLIKAMEDIRLEFDGTVRNSIGDIVQFRYGEDGLDGAKLIRQTVELRTRKKVNAALPVDIKYMLAYGIDNHLAFAPFTTPNPSMTPLMNEVLAVANVSAFDDRVVRRYDEAKISPGEMVGVIAAQSLGQPITQMTLNTFHQGKVYFSPLYYNNHNVARIDKGRRVFHNYHFGQRFGVLLFVRGTRRDRICAPFKFVVQKLDRCTYSNGP